MVSEVITGKYSAVRSCTCRNNAQKWIPELYNH